MKSDDKLKNVIVKSEGLLSEHDYLFGTKKKGGDSRVIDVQSKEDFPTLFDAP